MIDRRRQLSMQHARTESIVRSARCRLVSDHHRRSSTLARHVGAPLTTPPGNSRLFGCTAPGQHTSKTSSRRSWGTLCLTSKGLPRLSLVRSSTFHFVGTLFNGKALRVMACEHLCWHLADRMTQHKAHLAHRRLRFT